MRLFRLERLMLSLLVLVSLAAAQSNPSPSNDGQNSGQAAQQGQVLPNPVADQPNLQQKEQQQETQAKRPQQSTFDVSGAAGDQGDQQLGEIRLMTRYTQIGGDAQGRARSFHIPGSNNLAEANYYMDRRIFGSPYRFQLLTMFRGTDDSSIDPERNSVQKGYIRLYSPRKEFIFGDALVNYSRLTFNQNIKGLSTSFKLGQSWKFSTVGGVFIDRYGSLFRDQPLYTGTSVDPNTGQPVPTLYGCFNPADNTTTKFVSVNDPQCGRPFTSVVAGARLEYAFTRDSTVGFNFSSSDDLLFTRRDQPFNTAPQPARNRVGSIDLKLQKRMFRMEGEFAYSGTNFDIRPGACIAPCNPNQPSPGWGFQTDWGARLDAAYRVGRFSFRGSYIRFEPNFASMNARQIADAQDIMFRVSYDLANWLTLDGTMRRYNDDLKRQKPFQQTLWGPEGRLIFHDLGFYRKALFEIGYRHRIIDASNSIVPVDPLTGKPTLTGGCHANAGGMICADRTLRQPYAEFTFPISTTFLTVGYERRQSIDYIQPSGNNNTDRIYGSLRGIYDFGGWHLNPSLRYEFERQSHRLDPDTYYGVDPITGLPLSVHYVNPLALLYLDRDNNRLATASLYMEAPRWFIVELQFRTSTTTAMTAGTLAATCSGTAVAPCTQSVLSPAGYDRPSYRANLTFKIANDENKLLIFSFERNSNFYFSGPTDQDPVGYPPGGAINPINFDERLMGVTFVYKFGNRAR